MIFTRGLLAYLTKLMYNQVKSNLYATKNPYFIFIEIPAFLNKFPLFSGCSAYFGEGAGEEREPCQRIQGGQVPDLLGAQGQVLQGRQLGQHLPHAGGRSVSAPVSVVSWCERLVSTGSVSRVVHQQGRISAGQYISRDVHQQDGTSAGLYISRAVHQQGGTSAGRTIRSAVLIICRWGSVTPKPQSLTHIDGGTWIQE